MLKKIRERLEAFAEKLSYKHMLILAGVTSLLLSVLVYSIISKATVPAKTAESPAANMVTVVVAAEDIAPRTILKENMLKLVELPENAVPYDALTDISMVVNVPASVQIMKDDVVTERKVYADVRMAGFVGMIPPDCRAMSIKVSDVTGVAGFAQPGDYVDIMVVAGDKGDGLINSNIVLQNVLLLAVNKTGPDTYETAEAKEGNPNQSGTDGATGSVQATTRGAVDTATVAVTPRQMMELAAAAEKGTIYLVLRPYQPKNNYVFDTKYTTVNKKVGTPAYQGPPSIAPPRAASSSGSSGGSSGGVEVIRGNSSSREGR